jgi:Ni,Fe-hydrogenase I large subunit
VHASRDERANIRYRHAMAPLRNIKRETFCRKLLEGAKHGISQAEAYEQSGYRTTGHASEVAASRLLSTVEVQRRIAELGAPAVRKTRVTIESLLNELETTITDARASKQHSVVVNALTLSAKLCGMLRDQIEFGPPGSFGPCETVAQVVEALLIDESPQSALQTLAEMREEVERIALTRATMVVAEPDRYRINEGELSLAALRPPPRKNGRGR